MRKCHRVGDLNQEFIFSQLWRLEVQDEDTGGFSFFWGLSSSLQRRLSSHCALNTAYSLCLCVSHAFLCHSLVFLRGHQSDSVRAHPHDLILT